MTSSDITQVQLFFICLRFVGCTGLLACTKDKCQRTANERRATQVTFRALLSSELLWQTAEPLPGDLGNKGTGAFIFREQGIFSNYFQGARELLNRLLGTREHQSNLKGFF